MCVSDVADDLLTWAANLARSGEALTAAEVDLLLETLRGWKYCLRRAVLLASILHITSYWLTLHH